VEIASGALSARVLTYGAALQDVRLAGHGHALTLGGPDLAAYEGPFNSFGTVIGPYANRMRDACAPLDGTVLRFAPNLPDGHLLHSPPGLHRAVWQVAEAGADHVTLALELAHMADGFPGARRVTARYSVAGGALRLDLRMVTDRPTLASLANHSYWCLDPVPGIDGHILQVIADATTELDAGLVATGRTLPVAGTEYDFRTPRELAPLDRLDINFCLSDAATPLRPVAILTGRSGITMEMATTAPGLQVYDGQGIDAQGRKGHGGIAYGARAGLALEAQIWPDAANNPGFAPARIDAAAPFEQVTEWRFSG
jgi:aldose 1-epimerase